MDRNEEEGPDNRNLKEQAARQGKHSNVNVMLPAARRYLKSAFPRNATWGPTKKGSKTHLQNLDRCEEGMQAVTKSIMISCPNVAAPPELHKAQQPGLHVRHQTKE